MTARPSDPKPVPAWFRNAKYGLFIHWGIYSVLGRGEQALYREHLRPSEYRRLADRFRPTRFCPDEWAALAKAAGMRYALLTTKHHDGFCMFDSATTGFTSARTGLRRDYAGEYARAFRRAGLKAGFYFSTADWSQPAYFEGPARDAAAFDAFVRCTHEQVRELCSNYGKVDVLWFDGVWPYTAAQWRASELVAMIRRLQPGAIINDRIGLPGDLATPEQTIPEQQFRPGAPWESCLTSTERFWGWHAGVRWKSETDAVRELCAAVEVGGNLVYNVGPRPDGTLPAQFRRLMAGVAGWMAVNGEAIHGTTPTVCDTTTFGLMTCRPRRVYLHVLHWPGRPPGGLAEAPLLHARPLGRAGRELILAGLRNKVLAARLLATGEELPFRQDDEHVIVGGLPPSAPDPRNTVIALDVRGTPRSHDWARERLWTGSGERTQDHARAVAARMGPWSRT